MTVRHHYTTRILLLVVFTLGITGARLNTSDEYTPFDKEFYLTDEQILFIRPGLTFEFLDVTLTEERKFVVTYSITDPRGLPLDMNGVFTPGAVSVSFLIGYIPLDGSQYVNYNLRNGNPTRDRGGFFTELGDGVYSYTFGNPLPEGFEADATHTIGAYVTRDLREFELDRSYANEVYTFVPSGADVTQIREVVLTENCNECHNPLAFHGGSRRDVRLCILCHTPQNVNETTGNTVDFKVMVHKIHRGANLPSVQAGTPYQIISSRGTVHDYSDIHFPQDIRNCEKCHKNAIQGENWITSPTRETCGSCHDDVVFESGENHAGGPQISDSFCASCHFPEGEQEFDSSVVGAHTVPYKSKQLKGLNIAILDVTNVGPGQNPSVLFEITENDGREVTTAELNFLNFNLAGPTTDYSTLIRESALQDSVPATNSYVYTFKEPIPADATGTFVVGAEAYRMVTLNPGTTEARDFRETAENPLHYIAVTDPEAVPRRIVVQDEKCEMCHDNLAFHGTIRHDPQYCVTCHIPSGTDEARRPETEGPPRSRHFKFMIHRIHRGHDLERDFTIYGFGNQAHNYNHLHFPGNLADCHTCHVDDSYELPLPDGLLPTTTPREFWSPIQPIAAACLGCHDSEKAAAHAYTMTAPFGESCTACHGEGAEFTVGRVHAH